MRNKEDTITMFNEFTDTLKKIDHRKFNCRLSWFMEAAQAIDAPYIIEGNPLCNYAFMKTSKDQGTRWFCNHCLIEEWQDNTPAFKATCTILGPYSEMLKGYEDKISMEDMAKLITAWREYINESYKTNKQDKTGTS